MKQTHPLIQEALKNQTLRHELYEQQYAILIALLKTGNDTTWADILGYSTAYINRLKNRTQKSLTINQIEELIFSMEPYL